MLSRIMIAVAVAVVMGLGATSTASAQTCKECDEAYDEDLVVWHKFGGECFAGGPTCAWCGGTSDCHSGWEQGRCHTLCNPEPEFAAVHDEVAELVKFVISVPATGATGELRALAGQIERREYLALAETGLELRDCSGRAVVQWILPDPVRQKLVRLGVAL